MQEAVRLERPIGVPQQSKAVATEPGPEDVYRVGTSAAILRCLTVSDGTRQAIIRGTSLFRIAEFLGGHPVTAARVQYIDGPHTVDAEIEVCAPALM